MQNFWSQKELNTKKIDHPLPDIRVWRTANEYQEAASLCDESRHYWAGAILAALAIEIYLKSFLSGEEVEVFSNQVKRIYKKTERGHNLETLYKEIPQAIVDIILRESKLLNPKIDLKKELIENKNIFEMARYPHEKGAADSVSNGIIRLAEHMKELVIKVAKYTHPS
jgi:hypothetical protein